MKTTASALIAAAVLSAAPAAGETTRWVQSVAGGRLEARVVTDAGRCPVLSADGRARRMAERAAPTADFAERICQTLLPAGTRRARVAGRDLPLGRALPRRLVILGDSGCRLKTGFPPQPCNDPAAWPFARVAALAAARKPDLVVHVGDYYYRETPCPVGVAACAGSPYGDRWPTWKAELFDPAAPLLAVAPWVFARGNHEDCARGGPGWFRLLDAARSPKACPAASDTFAVNVAGARLFVVDSADTEDATAPPARVAVFGESLDPVRGVPGRPAWIVTHRPVWSALRSADALTDGMVNATERAAVKARDLSGVQLVLSGHVHNFTSLAFGPPRPPQLVVGTGGDLMAANDTPPPLAGTVTVDGLAAQAFTLGRWGYFLFERRGGDWVGAFRDLTDTVVARCRLHARALTCAAAPDEG